MAQHDFKQTAVGSIVTPASGYNSLFFDTAGVPWYLDSTGGQHTIAGGVSSIVAASAGLNSTETVVATWTAIANSLAAGTTIRVQASGVCTSTVANASHFRLRIGSTTLTGNILVDVSPTAAASGTAIPFLVELLGTVRTAGAGGTAIGSGMLLNNGVTGVSAAAVVVAQTTATVAVDTTAQKFVELTYQAAAVTTTCTFHNASIEIVK